MSDVQETKAIHLPTYLKVLQELPEISAEDITAAERTLQSALGDSYAEAVHFHRGLKKGDGLIHVLKIFHTDGGEVLQTQITFRQTGAIDSGITGLSDSLPLPLGRYFFAGVFGMDEFGYPKPRPGSKPAPRPRPTPKPMPLSPLLVQGAMELYDCARQAGGDLYACNNSSGAQKIAQQKLEIVNNHYARAEQLWKSAEEMREASRGCADGDPDDIQDIMNRFAPYRFYAGSADDLENARMRVQKAEEMMRAIGNDSGGWPQFKKRYCGKPQVIETEDCGFHQTGTRTTYRLNCSFNVSEILSSDNCKGEESPLEHLAVERDVRAAAKTQSHNCP